MDRIRFKATILTGHKEDACEVPFDPAVRWKRPAKAIRPGRRGHPVEGRINGVAFASFVVPRSRRFWLLIGDEVERAAGVAAGDEVAIEIRPAGPAAGSKNRSGESSRRA